jgi:hypothetical protein
MTREHYKKLKSSLEAINKINLQVDQNQVVYSKNKVKIEYQHTIIDLGDYTIIVSGEATQFHRKNFSSERIFLMTTVLDKYNEEQTTTKKQHTEIRKLIHLKTA